MKTVDIKSFERYYTISDTGEVFSKRKNRLIKPTIAMPTGYVKVFLVGDNERRWHSVHRLVLTHFVGECPRGMESHHKDHDKENNNDWNLEWVTHSENILRSFRDNHRHSWWLGKKRGEYSEEHRHRMALAKHKPVMAYNGIETLQFDSVEGFLSNFNTYRKKFNRYVGTNRCINGYKIRFV